jgi:hypothetical protein
LGSSLPQKGLKLTERETFRVVYGALQQFFPFSHIVTICSYSPLSRKLFLFITGFWLNEITQRAIDDTHSDHQMDADVLP